jgi:SNF2 family DNA or RNA helicase
MPHSPLDIYAQFRVLNPKVFGVNFTRFRARYAIMQACSGAGGAFNKVVDYQNMDELNQKFYANAHRVEKRDVLDLPDVMHEIRYTELEPKSRKAYDEIEKEFVTAVKEGELTVQNALSKMLRLAQITGGTLPLDESAPIPIGQEKLDVLEDILTDLPESEPVVIFTRFTMELQRIKALCEKLGRSCAELSGHENQLDAWQRGKFNCLAAQIKSGSEGVDLTRARYTVYLSKGFSLGTYEQSLARIDRPGQTREGLFFHILCRNTVDIREHRALKDRKRVVESVLAEVQVDTPNLMEEAVTDALAYKNLLNT